MLKNEDGLQVYFRDPKTGDPRPAVWRDKQGIMHRAIGDEVHRGVRLLWTACQQKDVPANAAWLQNPGDQITCEGCQQFQRIEEEDQRERELENGQFGVGA